jgi:hypothetical protein
MAVERPTADWMWELPLHYERMRRAYPDHELYIVFDIDGTILDVRYLVAHALLAYDREHATRYFHGCTSRASRSTSTASTSSWRTLALPAPVRADVLAWYAKPLWSPEAVLASNQPYQGVLGVIRWLRQPRAAPRGGARQPSTPWPHPFPDSAALHRPLGPPQPVQLRRQRPGAVLQVCRSPWL